MIVFITTGYNENVIGGSDLWVSNFIDNIFPLIKEPFALLIDGRPYINRKEDFYKLYTFDNDGKTDALLDSADKVVFLHHSYKPNPIIQKYLHKTYLTFVHAFIPDMVGLNDGYENLMTRLDWHWQKDILDNSKNIVWIGYEKDTIHTYYPKTITIPNYYEWKNKKPFVGIIDNKVGYAARCETRKNAHYLDSIPAFIFSNKYDYKRMLEGSKINASVHQFIEFDYCFHNKFFEKNFQIFHGAYTKEPFGYAIFDAIDNGKLPILDRVKKFITNNTHIDKEGNEIHTPVKYRWTHGATDLHMGDGMLVYSFIQFIRAKVCVCIGSGGGFIPRLMTQSRYDLWEQKIFEGNKANEWGDTGTTIIVDAVNGIGGFTDWTEENSFLRFNFQPQVILETSERAFYDYFVRQDIKIDYLHIDGDHSYEGVKKDFELYSSIMSENGIITIHDIDQNYHDTFVVTENAKEDFVPFDGPAKYIKELEENPEWNLVNLKNFRMFDKKVTSTGLTLLTRKA